MYTNLFESGKKYTKKSISIFILSVLVAGVAWYALAQRPSEFVGEEHTAGDNILEVYSSRKITQSVHPIANTISGIELTLAMDSPLPPEDTPLFIRVVSNSNEKEVRNVQAQFKELYRNENERKVLRISFPLLTQTKHELYSFSIEAPSLSKNLPLTLAYQGDGAKYTEGELFINTQKRAGALGFLLYEQPTIFTKIVRWSLHPDHKVLWVGIFLLVGASFLLVLLKNTKKEISTESVVHISKKELLIASILTIGAVFIVFQPALSLFFFQDDIPILLRAKSMQSWTELIFTNHPYMPEGVVPTYSIGFYRPISYSLFPWIVYQLFGLSAVAHHAVHLCLFAILSLLIYVLSRSFGPPLFASVVMGLWLVHSSKIDIAYWLSSSQDVLSSLFFILALVLYIHRKKGVCLFYVLALFSKDFSVLFPCIVILFELYKYIENPEVNWRTWAMSQLKIQAPLIFIIGIYLVIRTIALGDPTLPNFPHQDHSYDIAVDGRSIVQNSIAYTSWTAESFVWPQHSFLQVFMSGTRLSGPFYPGLIVLVLSVTSIIIVWKKRELRNTLLFGMVWWVVLLLPNLLMINERTDRWLTLPLWGSALAVTSILWKLIPSRPLIQRGIATMMLIGLLFYGIWVARLPQMLTSYVALSENARIAISQYEKHTGERTNVFFVDVPEEIQGTVNRNLLLLFFENVPKVKYVGDSPTNSAPSEVVINPRNNL